jgi:hypothetical protein
MSLPLAGRSARGSEGIGSGRGGIAGAGEPVDRRPRPHIGGPVASPSKRRPSPRRPVPPHAREQYSPVRPAGWVPSRASWPTCRFPVAHGRKRPHWRDSGPRESELVIELRSCEEEAGVAVDDAGPVRWGRWRAPREEEPSRRRRVAAWRRRRVPAPNRIGVCWRRLVAMARPISRLTYPGGSGRRLYTLRSTDVVGIGSSSPSSASGHVLCRGVG